jgi:hypothetical protein
MGKDAKNGRIDADTEDEHEDNGRVETGRALHPPKRISKVGQQVVERR